MKTKETCNVLISSPVDNKVFIKTMKKHNIKILKKHSTKNGIVYTLNSEEQSTEEILIYSSLSWSFN